MAIVLQQLGYTTGLDLEKIKYVADLLKPLKEEMRESGLLNPKVMDVDPETLIYQVPGGMLSNLLSQLKEAKQAHKYEEVLREVPRVREELGFPPLVTPLSQMNVISGVRYKMVPKEIKDYVKGLYGTPPGPISLEMQEKIIGSEEVLTMRPADLLEPEMDNHREALGSLAESTEDVLMYALFPTLALPFLRKRQDPFYDIQVQNVTVTI